MNGDESQMAGEELWRHSTPQSTRMWEFIQQVNKECNRDFKSYHDLYEWSVDQTAHFWKAVWQFCGVRASQPFEKVVDEAAPMFPRPSFFKGAKLNFAENLLFPTQSIDPNSPAIIAATEVSRETVTWKELRSRVAKCQAGLATAGLKEGDRVAGFVGNNINAIVAMLATTSIGAIWTAISPDSGVAMVLDRLKQIGPVCLFADNAQFYNGKTFEVLGKVREIVAQLDTLKSVVVFPAIPSCSMEVVADKKSGNEKWWSYDDFVNQKSEVEPSLTFAQLPPDTPIYILYSSGTTGAPKCIVHGAIGTLIQHKKEHILHCSVLPGDHLFYYTTCTWMMWHWLVSGLASGATLIVYDGSPMRYRSQSSSSPGTYDSVADDLGMPRLIEELEIKHFGTSAKYLSVLEQKNVFPREHGLKLPSLKAVYNTASPLAPSTFRYVYKAFGPDINLGSITGGTDIISLFGAANPLLSVHAGEIQGPGLGMAIRAFSEEGEDVTLKGEPGDLVCVKTFPCQPVAFWGTGGEAKYSASYFERFRKDGKPGTIWHHGDFVQCNAKTGGMIMLGRSDGVLNPAGVRFGSAEIYNVLLKYFPAEVADGLCIGQRREKDTDETVVLFCKMEEGKKFTPELADRIKKQIRSELSARHVPGIVDECPDIPVTVNGKKIEGAVKKIISGSKVKTSASVANVECLEFYQKWADAHV